MSVSGARLRGLRASGFSAALGPVAERGAYAQDGRVRVVEREKERERERGAGREAERPSERPFAEPRPVPVIYGTTRPRQLRERNGWRNFERSRW